MCLKCHGNYTVNIDAVDWKKKGIFCIENSSEPLLTHIEAAFYTQRVIEIDYYYIKNGIKRFRRAIIEPATKETRKTKDTDVIVTQYYRYNLV